MTSISFWVPGICKTAGSKRAFIPKGWKRAIITDDCKGSKDWRGDVKRFAVEHLQGPLLEGALEVTMTFYRTRPKSHLNSRGNVKASAVLFPISKPDALKLARAVEDSLTGVIWKDDAQIVTEHLRKRYGQNPGCQIEIKEMRDDPAF